MLIVPLTKSEAAFLMLLHNQLFWHSLDKGKLGCMIHKDETDKSLKPLMQHVSTLKSTNRTSFPNQCELFWCTSIKYFIRCCRIFSRFLENTQSGVQIVDKVLCGSTYRHVWQYSDNCH